MSPTYLKNGISMLPGIKNIEALFEGHIVSAQKLDASHTLGTFDKGALLPDPDLKKFGLSRNVKKTSERQARWVIHAAVEAYRATPRDCLSENIGLFLGLGTVDCDDKDEPVLFSGNHEAYLDQLLFETKPLSVLSLLNSTTASHISQMLNITGVNAVFSPATDAGAQAILESHYSLLEGQCEEAVIAAGSQKISPWYFKSNQIVTAQWGPMDFPSESASAIKASTHPQNSEGRLISCQRSFSEDKKHVFPKIETVLPALQVNGQLGETQIVVTGKCQLSSSEKQKLKALLPKQPVCMLDQLIGYTGPPGALHAINLGFESLKCQRSLCSLEHPAVRNPKKCNFSTKRVLTITLGPFGQYCYLVMAP